MSTPTERIWVFTPEAAFAASLRYALEALEPNLLVDVVTTGAEAEALVTSTVQPHPFLALAHATPEHSQPAEEWLAQVAHHFPQTVRVLTGQLPPVQTRAAVLRTSLSTGLFAFVHQGWLLQNLGPLLDKAREHRTLPARKQRQQQATPFWLGGPTERLLP
jgi:hypothetical protein